jgi:hypothetical protein
MNGARLLSPALCLVVGLAACGNPKPAAEASPLVRGEGLDPTTLPVELRPDYEVFALRCSKCHSLARPLQSDIDDDDYWVRYVARMRQQPGSGITAGDEAVILRFLFHYAREIRRKKAAALAADGGV